MAAHKCLTVDGPTVVSFSGGRTSAYMLRLLLDAHNGMLPADCHVVFANTGKEDEKTLQFVRDCERAWDVPIVWVEYTDEPPGWRRVTYESASRNGEPFEALIRKRNYLPNPVARFCTVELKILRIVDYMRSLGHDEFDVLVGIRADEPRRVASVRANPSGGTRGVERRMPLAELGATKNDVSAYWRSASFDLALPNVNGITLHGNCDLCFLKGKNTVLSLIRENPQRAIWWAKMESIVDETKIWSGNRFRADRPSYAQMLAYSRAQIDMIDSSMSDAAEDPIECALCTD